METWTVNMDVTFEAKDADHAIAVAHQLAEMIEQDISVTEVTLGNYTKEDS